MTPFHILILVLGVSAMLVCSAAYRSYLSASLQKRLQDAQATERLRLIDLQNFAAEQETRRLEILAACFPTPPSGRDPGC